MNDVSPHCPSDVELSMFAAGVASDDDLQRFETHLSTCANCLDTVRLFDHATDQVIQALGSAPPKPLNVDSDWLQSLLDRAAGPAPTVENILDDGTAPDAAHGDIVAELQKSWEPAAVEGELGRLGDFQLIRLLGAGGMGAVFEARDLTLERPVAIKLLHPKLAGRSEASARFLREARSAAAVRHDHVVTIYQVGQVNGLPFIAQELLHGESLARRLQREKSLPVEEAVRVAREVAAGLAAAHRKGLLHRDIKPANIWLEAPNGRVKILDFGLARLEKVDQELTQTGVALGTPGYMSPEQARGDLVDARSDLFSLGCMLYVMLTGRKPFARGDLMATLTALATEEPPPIAELNPAIPPALCDLVTRLLAKDRDLRIATADEVVALLAQLSGAPQMRPQATSSRAVAPAESTRRATSSERGRGTSPAFLIGLALAGVVIVAAIIIKIRHPDGRVEELEVSERAVVTIESNNKDVQPPAGEGETKPTVNEDSFFDQYRAEDIPAAERYEWQPKELVAVFGSHRQRLWHPGSIIQFTSDGLQLAAADVIGGVLVTQIDNGRILQPYDYSLKPFTLSPDGKLIAAGHQVLHSQDRIEMLNLGQDVAHRFTRDGNWLYCLESPQRSEDVFTLLRRSLRAGDKRPTGGVEECRSYAVAPDGKTVAIITDPQKPVGIYDFAQDPPALLKSLPDETGKALAEWSSTVNGITFDAKGRLLTLGPDDIVRWWRVEPEQPELVAEVPTERKARVILCDRTGKRVLIFDGVVIEVWDLDDLKVIRKRSIAPLGTGRNTQMVTLSDDGQRVATTHLNGEICVYDLSTAGGIMEIATKPDGVARMFPFADGRTAVVVHDNMARAALWRFGATEIAKSATEFDRKEVRPQCISPSGAVFMAENYNKLSICDVTQGELKQPLIQQDIRGDLYAAAIRPVDGKVIMSTADGKKFELWRATWTGKKFRLGKAQEVSNCYDLLRFVDGGRHLIARSWVRPEIDVWRIEGDELVPRPSIQATTRTGAPVVVSQDNTIVLIFDPYVRTCTALRFNGGAPKPFDAIPQQQGRTGDDVIVSAAISTDNRIVAISQAFGEISLWDLTARQRLHQIKLPGGARSMFFDAPGRHLITANQNGTVYVLRLPDHLVEK